MVWLIENCWVSVRIESLHQMWDGNICICYAFRFCCWDISFEALIMMQYRADIEGHQSMWIPGSTLRCLGMYDHFHV